VIDLIPYLAIATGAIYGALLLSFRLGIALLRNGNSPQQFSVTVVIPASNEAHNIEACLEALSNQTYPAELIEIIVVDDNSTDETVEQARKWIPRTPNLKVLSANTDIYVCPKKNALAQGIRAGSGDIILTTDADCQPSPRWIASTVSCFGPMIGMVAGFAPLNPQTGVLGHLLAFQSLAVNALAAGSIGMGFPLSCSGRNLAYRRTTFDQAGGFDTIGHIRGGDDVLLMRAILTRTNWRIGFNPDPEAQVSSKPHLDSLYRRQLRYQSKSIHFGIPVLILLATVYIFHITLAALMFLALNQLKFQVLSLILVGAKLALDGALIWRVASPLQSKNLLVWFPLAEILALPYVILIGGLGAVIPSRWK
jgi:biofilm PGA synthesis N-glycosyltransferase PgaC